MKRTDNQKKCWICGQVVTEGNPVRAIDNNGASYAYAHNACYERVEAEERDADAARC